MTEIILVGFRYSSYFWESEFPNLEHYTYDKSHVSEMAENVLNLLDEIKDSNLKIVFYSCHGDIFNLFGNLIYCKKINESNVKVILFDKNGERIKCLYNKSGIIIGFPYGFF
jgi:hypothetical protein